MTKQESHSFRCGSVKPEVSTMPWKKYGKHSKEHGIIMVEKRLEKEIVQ